jgi:hypothetical protein
MINRMLIAAGTTEEEQYRAGATSSPGAMLGYRGRRPEFLLVRSLLADRLAFARAG